jgi:hypothetical protein
MTNQISFKTVRIFNFSETKEYKKIVDEEKAICDQCGYVDCFCTKG